MTVPITTRALVQRINRALTKDGKMLKAARGRAKEAYGAYFIVDTRKNQATDGDIDIEKLGRKLGVLKDFERIAEQS